MTVNDVEYPLIEMHNDDTNEQDGVADAEAKSRHNRLRQQLPQKKKLLGASRSHEQKKEEEKDNKIHDDGGVIGLPPLTPTQRRQTK